MVQPSIDTAYILVYTKVVFSPIKRIFSAYTQDIKGGGEIRQLKMQNIKKTN